MRTLEQHLHEIFAPNKSGLGGTAVILTSPSSIDARIAQAVADDVDMDQLAAAAGVVAARVLADALEQRALRPADYTDMPEVCKTMSDRLVKLLSDSEAFQKAFYNALRMRG